MLPGRRYSLFLMCLGWQEDLNESSYTSHVHYGSITDWYWWVLAITVGLIHERCQKLSQIAFCLMTWVTPGLACHCITRTPWCSLPRVPWCGGPGNTKEGHQRTLRKQFLWCSLTLTFKRKCVGQRSSVTKESVQDFLLTATRWNSKCLQRNYY